MGPGANSNLPSRPKFGWDIRTTPWTDGRGNQEGYARSVKLWEQFHDKLAENNPNKIQPDLRGICLKSQLFGRAYDLCSGISDTVIGSEEGTAAILAAIHIRDPLSVTISVFNDFDSLLLIKRGNNESYINYEARFAAQVARYHAHGKTLELNDSILAMMLLSGSGIDDAQRIPILSSASSGSTLSPNESNDVIVKQITYEKVASVLRQCDTNTNSQIRNSTYVANTANIGNKGPKHNTINRRQNKSSGYNRPRMTPDEFRAYKLKTKCTKCGNHGHWSTDHLNNGEIKDGLPSIPPNNNQHKNNTGNYYNNNMIDHQRNQQDNCNNNSENSNQNVVSFTASLIAHTASTNNNNMSGPLVDDGAPFSAIGMTELRLLYKILPTEVINLESIPDSLNQYKWWQFGTGSHSSDKRRIIGSINIKALSDLNNDVLIRHLVIEGSSQWVIGRNVTRASDVLHYSGSKILMPPNNGIRDSIKLIDDGLHSYISASKFYIAKSSSSILTGHTAAININKDILKSWSQTKRVVDKVHRHTCGHSTYSDIKTLLERNKIWSDDVKHYLGDVIRKCTACIASSTPPPSRKVALGSLNRQLNDVVMIDHFYLDETRFFHCMDSYSRFSSVYPVPDGTLFSAILAFESTWIAQFWPPVSVQGDQAFAKKEFIDYLNVNSINFRPVPSRRHHKNTLEPKHNIIRSIYLRLVHSSPKTDKTVLALRSVSISNDLYGSDVMSSFEIAKGYTKPLVAYSTPNPISSELVQARDTILAKRKLNLIMRSNATTDPVVNPGDLVQIYVKTGNSKRGKWSSPRIVQEIDRSSGTVTVPGSNGHKIISAVEDTRSAIVDDDLASVIVESIDKLDLEISDALDIDADENSSTPTNNFSPSFSGSSCSDPILRDNMVENEGFINNVDEQNIGTEDNNNSKLDDSTSHIISGDRIEVYWPLDDQHYPGTVGNYMNGVHTIVYDDGEKEELNLENEQWRHINSLNSLSIYTGPKLKSNEQEVLNSILETIGNKSFMRHHAQGFQQPVLIKAYNSEENEFKKTISIVHKSKIPNDANVISSHTIYKVKVNDDNSLKLKARIAPHGNEDSIKNELKSDCNMCSPSGVRIVLSVSSLYGWRLTKADVKAAFLKTGKALRDVYVIPPRESNDKEFYWLLLTAAYGLVNSNAKWQSKSDQLFIQLGLTQCQVIPQLFYVIKSKKLILIAAKIVDDILVTGEVEAVDKFISEFDKVFKFGTVAHGPGNLRFYGMNIVQDEDYTCSIDAEDKLKALEPYPITRLRKREVDSLLTEIEKSSFMSLNSSLGWLGIAASPFCAFYSSHLQQMLPNAKVSVLKSQSNALRVLKNLGTSISFPKPKKGKFTINIAIFADAGRLTDHGQLSFISGLLIGPLAKESIFHVLSWMSHKSKRPVRSIAAAETLAASEAIDEGKTLKSALSTFLSIPLRLIIIVDSKDLYTSLSTRRNSIDRSIRADVNCIRFEYEMGNVDEICWLPGSINLADPGTKTDSPLCQALQLLMYTGKIPIDMTRQESRRNDRSLG